MHSGHPIIPSTNKSNNYKQFEIAAVQTRRTDLNRSILAILRNEPIRNAQSHRFSQQEPTRQEDNLQDDFLTSKRTANRLLARRPNAWSRHPRLKQHRKATSKFSILHQVFPIGQSMKN